MNEKNLNVFIDFGSSKIRLGAYDNETSKNIFISERDCVSNFNLKKFDINNSTEIIRGLIKSAEKKIEKHINKINLMIDTPDMFSINISIKKNFDSKKNLPNDIKSLLNEAKSLVQKNYHNQKIIHMIVKKFIVDDNEFFEIPKKEINYDYLILEIKFICFSNKVWKYLQDGFNKNYLTIDNLYSSSYVRSSNYSNLFNEFNFNYPCVYEYETDINNRDNKMMKRFLRKNLRENTILDPMNRHSKVAAKKAMLLLDNISANNNICNTAVICGNSKASKSLNFKSRINMLNNKLKEAKEDNLYPKEFSKGWIKNNEIYFSYILERV